MVRVIPLRDAAITLGRDLTNQVVLVDESVSGHHAVVQRSPHSATVRDLGSTNGTFVNEVEVAVAGSAPLAHGDELRLGEDVRLRIRQLDAQPGGHLVVRDLAAGTAHLVDGDRFRIGAGPRCDVRLPDGPAEAATLIVHPDGEAWLGLPDEERAVGLDEVFEVAGSAFRIELSEEALHRAPTVRPLRGTRYPYRLVVTLDAAAGGLAVIEDPTAGRRCQIVAEQRVTLIYQLARRLQADRGERLLPELAGWCHDEDLIMGVWGREALRGAASRYSVLLHRVRKDLEAALLDPWCLEKRRGATRLQVADVRVS